MNIFVKLKKFFRRRDEVFEIWDTSALSTWSDIFMKNVLSEKIRVIIAEGTNHEISNGRHNHKVCRTVYHFIRKYKKVGLIEIDIPKNEMLSAPIDDQVVVAAYERYKKGFDITLVTCDVNQASKAEDRGVKVQLLKGVRDEDEISEKIDNHTSSVKTKNQAKLEIKETQSELVVPCITKSNKVYINVKQGIAVYDAKGKRKIGKENLIEVSKADSLVYKERKYSIEAVADTYIALKKFDSA